MTPRGRDSHARGGSKPTKRHASGGAQRDVAHGEQVEGRRAVRELLRAGRRRVRELWISNALDESEILFEIRELAQMQRVPMREVPRARLDGIAKSEAPQGVLAFAEPLREVPIDDLLDSSANNSRVFLLILDGVTDPHNVGALARSAECAGVTGMIIGKHRGASITPTVAKASAGAIEFLPIAYASGIPSVMQECKKRGIWTVGLDGSGDADVFDLALADQPLALIVGAEGAGLSRLVRERCDVLARLDQRGQIESLNVASAGAIAMFAVAHRRFSNPSNSRGG